MKGPSASRALTPMEITPQAVSPKPPAQVIGVVEMSSETTDGSLALAPDSLQASSASSEQAVAPPLPVVPANLETDLDRIREAICAALEEKGHNTAAVLLDAGRWTLEGDTIQVEVGIKKTMLALTMNIEAEKIVKNALRAAGASQKLVVTPGENGVTNGTSKPRTAASGSVQAAAMEHPLVKQAMELFEAEVRSVLDLRDKK